jgi:hypothetical protein
MNIEPGRLEPTVADENIGGDTRRLALDCMMMALEYLDEDPRISPIVGSQLQLAIDRLASTMPKV